jgi:hypothetical protein
MSTVIRRHQNDTKTFKELTVKEQALAINAHTVWYLKAARAHGGESDCKRQPQKSPTNLSEWRCRFGICKRLSLPRSGARYNVHNVFAPDAARVWAGWRSEAPRRTDRYGRAVLHEGGSAQGLRVPPIDGQF